MDKENILYVNNEVYLAIKNKMMSFAVKLLEVEDIMLSKIVHKEKDKYYMFSLICGN
jgi:hypothetical protein